MEDKGIVWAGTYPQIYIFHCGVRRVIGVSGAVFGLWVKRFGGGLSYYYLT